MAVLISGILITAVSTPLPAQALSPEAKSFLRESGLDPSSADVRAADKDGSIVAPNCSGRDNTNSLESLAKEKSRKGVVAFVQSRKFIREVKADFVKSAKAPKEYNGCFLVVKERRLAMRKILGMTPGLSPQATAFVKSIGLDPEEGDTFMVEQHGEIKGSYLGDPMTYSLESLARQKKKNGVIRFVTTRAFIRRLEKDFDATQMPAENYDASFLTAEELILVSKKTGAAK